MVSGGERYSRSAGGEWEGQLGGEWEKENRPDPAMEGILESCILPRGESRTCITTNRIPPTTAAHVHTQYVAVQTRKHHCP